MLEQISRCDSIFGFTDFDHDRVNAVPIAACPVRGCATKLTEVAYGRKTDKYGNPKTKLWCSEHGIRLHSNTFVYWNGPERHNTSKLRNFIVAKDLAEEVALKSGAKAESHRLGYEMSEDALSWNVFVSLAVVGKLKDAASFLTGRDVTTEPELYLWGRRIDVLGRDRGRFEPLWDVRERLEKDIHTFNTEPDVMLVVADEIAICIEAKFASGNSLASEHEVRVGEKPIARSDLFERYLQDSTKASTRAAIRPNPGQSTLHSQLFRNLVFASEMAPRDWHVVNLVSRTQHALGTDNPRSSFANPTSEILSCLSSDSQSRFTYRTWEELYVKLVKDTVELSDLAHYMRTKSAHYRPAFNLMSV